MEHAVVLLLCLAIVGCSAEMDIKSSNVMCPPAQPTRVRDCAPWGLNPTAPNTINPAFQYSWPNEDPLDKCTGVINMFYFFKITVFASRLETSVQMRAVKSFAEILWNVNAHFNDTATDTLGKLIHSPWRRAPTEMRNSIRQRNIALAFGLARVAAYLIPTAADDIYNVLDLLVSDHSISHLNTTSRMKTAFGIGNRCAKEYIGKLKKDGWNSEGDLTSDENDQFEDYTGYTPVNTWDNLVDPTKWQPLQEINTCNQTVIARHTTPQLRSIRVRTFAISHKYIKKQKLPGAGWTTPLTGQALEWYIGNATRMITASAGLTDEQKLIAEFFDRKVVSFGGFERWYTHKNNWCHDDWITFEQMSSAFYDATILAWKEKLRINAVRPLPAIRWLASQPDMLPATVQSWGGPGKGTVSMSPKDWRPYLRTMPHAEYPSGTSCYCGVFVEWVKKFQTHENVDLTLTWKKGCGLTEPNVVPAKDTTVTFKTLGEMMKVCQESRIWAGNHFEASLSAGVELCSPVADITFQKVQRLKSGRL